MDLYLYIFSPNIRSRFFSLFYNSFLSDDNTILSLTFIIIIINSYLSLSLKNNVEYSFAIQQQLLETKKIDHFSYFYLLLLLLLLLTNHEINLSSVFVFLVELN
jgi:hypothetical protein